MSKELFNQGIELGRERHSQILQRGAKWKSRNIPIFIRDNLLVPYYIVESGAEVELWVINYPMGVNGKVAFSRYATVPYEASPIHVGSKPSG